MRIESETAASLESDYWMGLDMSSLELGEAMGSVEVGDRVVCWIFGDEIGDEG